MEAKRPKLQAAPKERFKDLATLLQRLQSLLASGGDSGEGDGGLDELLEELATLQASLNGSSQANEAFKAISSAQAKLQVAIVALQAAVDKYTPPAGYKPPAAGDEAYVRGLLSYAHKLSYSSSAPVGYQPGQPLYFFKPPAPQEAEMRASQLHAFAREWEARQQALEAQRQAAARGAAVPAAAAAAAEQQPAPAAAARPASAAGIAPGGDLAAMAAQHGLDLQQLLASMPAGWKPGDPIPLGPAAAAVAQPAAPAAAAMTPSAATQQQAGSQPSQQQQVSQQQQREATPMEVEEATVPAVAPVMAAPAAPRLAGIFLNDDFGQYEYVSSAEEDSDEEDDSDDDSE